MESSWTKSERSLYLILCGITAAAVVVWGVGAFIDACRTRPKVQVLTFGIKPGKGGNNGEKARAESSSALD